MKNIYKIVGIALVSTLVCLNIVYADSVSLRVPSSFRGENKKYFTARVKEVAAKFQVNPADIISTPYSFGEFKDTGSGIYKGDLFINGEQFNLEITIPEEGSPSLSSFIYVYAISYGGKKIAFVHVISRGSESEYFIPEIYGIEVDPEYRSDRIGNIKESLKGVYLASVLINIALKDMSLDNRIDLSGVVYKDAMGFLPPESKIISLLEKFKMMPLDTNEIIDDINAGSDLSIKGLEKKKDSGQRYPYFTIGKRVVMLKPKEINRPLSAAKAYVLNKNPATLIKIILGKHPEYGAYIGGNWGLEKGEDGIKNFKWLEKYLKSVPSWQMHAPKSAAGSLNDYMRGWFGWFYKGWQWKETERVINTKFAENADRKKAMIIIDGLRREISKRSISIGRRDAINAVYYSNIMAFVYKARSIKELQERCDIVLAFLSSVGFHEWWDIVIHRELTDYYFNRALKITEQYGAFQITNVKEDGKILLDSLKKAPARGSRSQL